MIKLPRFLISLAVICLTSLDTISNRSEITAGDIQWVSIEEAQQLVKDNPRKVFIDIYADWCGWCKVMDRKTFSNGKVQNYVNENYYAVRIDAESSNTIVFNGKELTERQLVQSFKVRGLPTIVFIDESFEKVKPVAGYQNASQFLKTLQNFNK